MMPPTTAWPSTIEIGVAARAHPGERICGDVHVASHFPEGALLAAIDGLGHGEEAAAAAGIAAAVLMAHPREPLDALVRRCHQELAVTRGAVMNLASFDEPASLMSWLGVGNVEGLLLRRDPSVGPVEEFLLVRSGVVGVQLPRLEVATLRVHPGDTLVFATDGVRTGFSAELARRRTAQAAAEGILARDGLASGDALVLVARYAGGLR